MNEDRILVVDDEPQIRDAFETAFGHEGYKVQLAASGEEALEILDKKNLQVMFVDLKLPQMSGVDFCRRVRKDKPIPIIYAMTGYASVFELADCREAGFDDYYTKPIELKTLLKAAEEAFEKVTRWKKRLETLHRGRI